MTAASKESWRLWCRLCAKEDPHGNVNVFFKDEQVVNGVANITVDNIPATGTELAAAIMKYFSVDVLLTDELPKMICTECLSLMTSLVNFSERVAKVQEMFGSIQNAKETTDYDLHEMRLKFKLLDEFREHVWSNTSQSQSQLPVPEVHFFETKPKINDLLEEEQEEKPFEIETTTTTTPTLEISTKKTSNPLEQANSEIKVEEEFLSVAEKKVEEAQTPNGLRLNNTLFYGIDIDSDDSNDSGDCGFDYSDSEDEEEYKPARKKEKKEKPTNTELKNDNVQNTNNDVTISNENVVPLDSSKAENVKKRGRPSRKNLTDVTKSSIEHEEKKAAREFPCSECSLVLKRKLHLRRHLKEAHGKLLPQPKVAIGDLTCTECSRIFKNRWNLSRHVRLHLPLELQKTMPCPYCGKKFSSNTRVKEHIKCVHTNERPFICEECGIAVRTNVLLKDHMLTHTDYAPFECDVCKKCFKSQQRLKIHKEIHDPNKHTCAECGLQLNSRATLNRHLLVHSDEMHHKCDYCGRAFKRAKTLKNHLILHTGLKPYSCDFCDRTFASGANCRSHKKKAHPEELAALEAAGGGKTYTRNIPKLEALKAVTRSADNLAPVVSKQSGNFAFGKKPKPSTAKRKEHKFEKNEEKEISLPAHGDLSVPDLCWQQPQM